MMSKTAIVIATLMVFAFAVPAQAEVQNVRISGDISVQGIYKDDYGLGGIKNNNTFNGSIFHPVSETQEYLQSQIRLRVGAELTNNVSGMIEILNQRDWDNNSAGVSGSGLTQNTALGGGLNATAANDPFDIILSRAYIQIENPYYEGLTVKLGRQNLQWGDGFVLGEATVYSPDPSNSFSSDEGTWNNAFDAARVIYTHGPWTFDAVAAKVQENSILRGDDEDLFGINISREFNKYDALGEIYFLGSTDASAATGLGEVQTTTNELWNIGVRGEISPWERMRLNGELVFQWGEEGGTLATAMSQYSLNGNVQQDIRAFAYDVRAEWDWLELPWPATLGAEWVFYSGEEDSEGGKSGAYRPLFRGKFYSFIREFQGVFYLPDIGITSGATNQHQIMTDVSFHPFNNEDLTFFGRWLFFWLDETPITGRGRKIGHEFDVQLEYAYTEDLLFRLRGGIFVPGDYFDTEAVMSNAVGQTATSAESNAKLLQAEVLLSF